MPLKLNDKKAIVQEVAEIANQSISAIAADYRGLTVSEMTDLRAKARATNVSVRIVRNTLARLAVTGTEHESLSNALVGPIVLMFAKEEPSAAARLLLEFIKTNTKLQVRGLTLSGQFFPPESLKAVAALPSRNEAIALLMSVMQAPITKLVRTFAEPYAGAVRVMGAVRDQKQAAA